MVLSSGGPCLLSTPLFGNTKKHIFRNVLREVHSIKTHPNNSQTVPIAMHVHISEVASAPRESQMDVCSSHLRTDPTQSESDFTATSTPNQRCMRKSLIAAPFSSFPCGQVPNIYCSWKGIQSPEGLYLQYLQLYLQFKATPKFAY